MNEKKEPTAITPTRADDYPEWYQQVIKAAEMAENSPVRGCMVIRPWGYSIWEKMQKILDAEIKDSGHENAYFPLFIPLSFLEKEAEHVAGFAKECAVVTHHRLEEKDGKLVPTGELEEPLIVRPTSETIIGESFSRWVESYRDLPLLINQWANVVRWEMRPRIFLRTTEFLWQEGHTVHASAEEALQEALKMHRMYHKFSEEILGIPAILGEKSPGERFPGAVNTFTLEVMTQDRKSLQFATSHYLGQNFAKASNIRFNNKDGQTEYGYTTSWGCTTRMIGALIMCHGDDDGLRLPPRIAPKQVVIIPFIPKPEFTDQVMNYAENLEKSMKALQYHGEPISVFIDKRDKRGGEKNWDWIKKGVPLRIEVGPRDIETDSLVVARRDKPHKDKQKISIHQFLKDVTTTLDDMQKNYFKQAQEVRDQNSCRDLKTFDEFKKFFNDTQGGFVMSKWCGDPETEKMLEDLKVTIRCLPLKQSGTEGKCILTGKKATLDAIFAKSY